MIYKTHPNVAISNLMNIRQMVDESTKTSLKGFGKLEAIVQYTYPKWNVQLW